MPRKVFVAGEILTAADVNTNLMDQAVMSFAGTAARGSAIPTPVEGMISYLEDSDTWEGYTTSWGPLGGKVLQVVSATDSTTRTTSSTSFTSATINATITPISSTSKLFVQWNCNVFTGIVYSDNSRKGFISLYDGSSDVAIRMLAIDAARSGDLVEVAAPSTIQYITTHSNSAITFTGRFKADTANDSIQIGNAFGGAAGAGLLTIWEIEA